MAAATAPRLVFAQEEIRNRVNETLRHLERSDIPGIGSKRLHLHEDAAYALIHIRQYHYAPDTSDDLMETIKACQHDIGDALEFLIQDPSVRLRESYQEGLVAGGDIAIADAPDNLRRFEDSKKADIANRALPEIVQKGADGLLRDRGKLTLKPAERYAEAVLAWKTDFDTPQSQENIFERREDVLIEYMLAAGEKVACTVYGAAHDWRNNVDAHNKRNPRKAISLLTLTPKALTKREEVVIVLNPTE